MDILTTSTPRIWKTTIDVKGMFVVQLTDITRTLKMMNKQEQKLLPSPHKGEITSMKFSWKEVALTALWPVLYLELFFKKEKSIGGLVE